MGNDTANLAPSETRRGMLRRGALLALSVPAVALAMNAAPAFARDNDDDDND